MEYEVLYYKRTNKVHKSKGVSKLDGILTVGPTDRVVLRSTDVDVVDDDDDDNDDNNKQERDSNQDEEPVISSKYAKKSSTSKKKQVAQSSSSGTIYSGRNQAFVQEELTEGQVVVLGGFQVEIIKRIQGKTVSATDSNTSTTQHSSGSSLKTLPRTTVAQPKTANSVMLKTLQPTTTKILPQKRKPNQLLSRNRTPNQSTVIGSSFVSTACPVREHAPVLPQQALATTMTTTSLPRKCATPKQPSATSKMTVVPRGTIGTGAAKAMNNKNNTVLPHIPLTGSIRSSLRPHQIEGIDFLWSCLNGKMMRGALLADEMGLGKTLMTIAVISALHKVKRSTSHVVVCPSSLVANWAKEFDKWLGKAGNPKRVAIKKGGEEGQQEIRSFCSGLKQNFSHQLGQVLIVSYDLFRMNVETFHGIKQGSIRLLVCDEAHRLKNTAGSFTLTALESLDTQSRLCLSATPIQNNLSEFFNLANFVCPGVLGDLPAFRKNYDRPIAAGNNKNATRQERERAASQSCALDRIVKTFMLRRLQKDVLTKMLPPRTEVLLFCKPSLEQCTVYRNLAKCPTAGDASEILTALTSLRKICTHPHLVAESGSEGPPPLVVDLQLSGKLKVLSDLLSSIREYAPQEKVVVVSNFTSALSVVESLILRPNNLAYVRLDGTTDIKSRQTIVDSFNLTSTGHSFCFLLSAKAGGCGLNLVGANRMVLLDPDWNPATDIQCMGRVYRQGQMKETVIYRLFTSGTIEEVIYQRQIHKGGLASATVDGKRGMVGGFSKEEIRDCLELKNTLCDTKTKLGQQQQQQQQQQWPDYSGAESIAATCGDEPLFWTATRSAMALGHIHVVDETVTVAVATLSKTATLPTGTGDEEEDVFCDSLSANNTEDSFSSEEEF